MAPPLGQYDPTKLINLGTNRWSFKPELGLSRAFGRWVVEMMAGVWLFTDNTDFFGGRTRKQDPIAATQLHVTFKFKRSMWLAGDANYYTGGRTTIGGKQNLDLQRNSRVGATFSSALDRRQAIRMSVSRGAFTRSAPTSPRSRPATATRGRAGRGPTAGQAAASSLSPFLVSVFLEHCRYRLLMMVSSRARSAVIGLSPAPGKAAAVFEPSRSMTRVPTWKSRAGPLRLRDFRSTSKRLSES